MTETLAAYCAQCRSRCGVLATVEEGRLLAVAADPRHPSGAKICPKGRAAPELVYSGQRLLRPLLRTKPKGAADPGWREISWDEALARTAEGLLAAKQRLGAEGVAFSITSPSGTAISDASGWIERFVRGFGSPNIVYATELCNWHKDFAPAFTHGDGIGLPDFAHSDCVLLWGHNPLATWLAQAGEVQQGLCAGAKLIVVDPRPAGFARRADAWLRLRPGSDAALALGLAHLLIRDGRFDADFMTRWSSGPLLVRDDSGRFLRGEDLGLEPGLLLSADLRRYDPAAGRWLDDPAGIALDAAAAPRGIACRTAFRRYAERCAAFPPERVQALTDVVPEALAQAADLLGRAKAVAHYHWTGLGQHAQATQASRAVALLHALTGSHDVPGGNVMQPGPALADMAPLALLPPAQHAKTLGLAERPLGPGRNNWVLARDVYRAILAGEPYRIGALVGFGANLLLSHPEGELAARALRALPFHVQLDSVMTPTAALADLVLPVSTGWEREGLRAGFDCSLEAQFHIQLKPAVIPPLGEARGDREILFALAPRVGLGELFFGGDGDAAWRAQLAPLGVTLEQLRAAPEGLRLPGAPAYRRHEAAGFATPTRRLEVWSETLLDAGQGALPDYAPPGAVPGFDLILGGAKTVAYCHSQHRHVPALRKLQPEPSAELNPKTAEARGIAEGDQLRIVTPSGSFLARARLTPGHHPGTVTGQHGWWQSCDDLGLPAYPATGEDSANVNLAVDGELRDPVSGAFALRSTPCRVERLAP
jgi:anaerobic selenocysteine-containing dehydrogenase